MIRARKRWLIVAPEPLPGRIGLIYIPDATKSTRNQMFVKARVLSVGPEVTWVKEGENVLISEYFGDELQHEGQTLRIGKERDIVGVIEEGEQLTIRPVADRVLLEKLEMEERSGALYLPPNMRERNYCARVVAVGMDAADDLKPGDTVTLPRSQSVQVRLDQKHYELIELGSILLRHEQR